MAGTVLGVGRAGGHVLSNKDIAVMRAGVVDRELVQGPTDPLPASVRVHGEVDLEHVGVVELREVEAEVADRFTVDAGDEVPRRAAGRGVAQGQLLLAQGACREVGHVDDARRLVNPVDRLDIGVVVDIYLHDLYGHAPQPARCGRSTRPKYRRNTVLEGLGAQRLRPPEGGRRKLVGRVIAPTPSLTSYLRAALPAPRRLPPARSILRALWALVKCWERLSSTGSFTTVTLRLCSPVHIPGPTCRCRSKADHRT
jgi:hypothetical protein